MVGANQVLACGEIDADLAADRAVDLRQQRRRHLDDRYAAQKGRRGEPGDVADNPAADGDDRCRAVRRGADQRVIDSTNGRELFEAFAIGNEDRIVGAGARTRIAMQPPDHGVRHDEPALRDADGVHDRREASSGAVGNFHGICARRRSNLQTGRVGHEWSGGGRLL